MPDELVEVEELREFEAAYDEMLPLAMEIEADEVVVCRADARLAFHNARRGVEAVLARQAEIVDALTAAQRQAIARVVKVAAAVVFAVSLCAKLAPRSSGEIAAKLKRAYELRRIMLLAAESAAEAGLLDRQEVKLIRDGRGNIDAAQDDVDLAALFRRNADALAGKTPVTAEMIVEAAEVGTWLVATLRPAAAPVVAARPEEVAAAADRRDRLWTLLQRDYEDVWKVGAMIFGRAVDDHVPGLQSRVA